MLGFITGTLLFAFLSLADRYSPVRLFFFSSLAGSLFNVAVVWWAQDATALFLFRFLTGFFIAGIYPVGMKVAADWYEKGLSKALGFLLGALILGTAFPHLLKNQDFDLPWKTVLYTTSLFAITGGVLMLLFIGDGPYRKKSGGFKWNALPTIFSSIKWRSAAFAYFGHMWELYTFWGFLPVIIALYNKINHTSLDIAMLSFLGIAMGSFSSITGGFLSIKFGSAKVGFVSLFVSGLCCLLSPFFFDASPLIFIIFILLWGLTVSPDSPQFSTLVAQYAPPELRGTALTIYNSIGFTISTISLFVFDLVYHSNSDIGGKNSFTLLGLGALFGLSFLVKLVRKKRSEIDE